MARKQRRTTRADAKDALLAKAAAVEPPAQVDVCVVGGGAAGLVAAITAAENYASVTVLERDLTCGRTILATGNGRCNMANVALDPLRYNNPAFVGAVCGGRWLEDVASFFRDCGLVWAEEAEGRLYPLSRQASSVREVLLERAQRTGVMLAPARSVQEIKSTDTGFTLRFFDGFEAQASHELAAQRVVLATGGNTTLDMSYDLGLATTPFRPMLCPLVCDSPRADLAALDGRRVHARARLLRKGREIACESGEVLFRRYGVSGIVVFNLSRHTDPGDTLELDLIPEVPTNAARELAAHTLAGILDPVVAQALMRSADSIPFAVELAKSLPLLVTELRTEDGAQVRRGGLVCEQFDPTTLEARALPGFHACGEALDVDGPCGGFNLAWAWKSGMIAGAHAGAPTRRQP